MQSNPSGYRLMTKHVTTSLSCLFTMYWVGLALMCCAAIMKITLLFLLGLEGWDVKLSLVGMISFIIPSATIAAKWKYTSEVPSGDATYTLILGALTLVPEIAYCVYLGIMGTQTGNIVCYVVPPIEGTCFVIGFAFYCALYAAKINSQTILLPVTNAPLLYVNQSQHMSPMVYQNNQVE